MRLNFKKIYIVFFAFICTNKPNLFSMQEIMTPDMITQPTTLEIDATAQQIQSSDITQSQIQTPEPPLQDTSISIDTTPISDTISEQPTLPIITPEEQTPTIQAPTQISSIPDTGIKIEGTSTTPMPQSFSILLEPSTTEITIPTQTPTPITQQQTQPTTPQQTQPFNVLLSPTISHPSPTTSTETQHPSFVNTPALPATQPTPQKITQPTTISIEPQTSSIFTTQSTFISQEPQTDLTNQIKNELISILGDPTKSGTIELFNSNIILESSGKFNQIYLQNIPSYSISIYTAIRNFYNNRTSTTLGSLQTLLINAQNKSFLNATQQSDIKKWLIQVKKEIQTALSTLLNDPSKTGTPALLNANIVMAQDLLSTPVTDQPTAIFNQTYLQNYPSASKSIYTTIKNFYINRTSSTLGDLQTLLINAQKKTFLTAEQNDDVTEWLSQIQTGVKTSLINLLKDPAKTGTTALFNTNVVSDEMYNQTYLQDYPTASNSIYTTIKKFYATKTVSSLSDLEILLTNVQNKSFLSAAQNADLAECLSKVTVLKTNAQSTEMTRVNSILNSLSSKTFETQFLTLQNLTKNINPIFDYSDVQQSFLNVLKKLHNSRPKTNISKLQALQTWYGTISTSILIPSGTDFSIMISDIETDLSSALSGSSSGIDSQTATAIKKALSKSNIKDKINGLINVVQNFGSQKLSINSMNAFSSGIMTVGGNDLNTINASYQAIKTEVSQTTKLSSSQKTKINNLIKNIKSYQNKLGSSGINDLTTLFINATVESCTLLGNAQKQYVANILKYTLTNLPNILNELNDMLSK